MIRFDCFSQELQGALIASGWRLGRKIDVDPGVQPPEAEGYRSHSMAVQVIESMGGLVVEPTNQTGPNFANDEPLNFNPLAAGVGQSVMVREIESVLGGSYFPIGEWLSYSSVFIDVDGFEFFVMSPVAADVHSETLAMVSHYHSFEAYRLAVGSVVDIGRPWMQDSRMDHLLVSLPYPYGPELEHASPEAGSARFLWLLPIHRSEAQFIRRATLDEFESMLDSKAVNILDPDRDPVA